MWSTKFIPEQLSEILSRLSVGGISSFLSDKIENIASIEPDAPRNDQSMILLKT